MKVKKHKQEINMSKKAREQAQARARAQARALSIHPLITKALLRCDLMATDSQNISLIHHSLATIIRVEKTLRAKPPVARVHFNVLMDHADLAFTHLASLGYVALAHSHERRLVPIRKVP
jgi:hypothetical protein